MIPSHPSPSPFDVGCLSTPLCREQASFPPAVPSPISISPVSSTRGEEEEDGLLGGGYGVGLPVPKS